VLHSRHAELKCLADVERLLGQEVAAIVGYIGHVDAHPAAVGAIGSARRARRLARPARGPLGLRSLDHGPRPAKCSKRGLEMQLDATGNISSTRRR